MLLQISALLLAPAQTAPMPAIESTAPTSTASTQLFIVTYSPGPAWEAGKPMRQQKLAGHMAHMKALFASGHILAAGGFTDAGVEGGMMILRASGIDDAHRIVNEDASVKAGVFVASVRAWTPSFDSKQPLRP